MKIWTSGTVHQVIEDSKTGLVDAIVTNPAVMAQWCLKGESLETLAAKVIEESGLPLYIQLKGPDVSDYLRQCDNLKKISEKIIPKIPSTLQGIQAAKILESKGLATLVTTVCSIGQAYACAAADVTAICPYYNRLQDIDKSADDFLLNISSIYKVQGVKTKIIPASIRTLQDVEQALKNGSHGVIVFSELFREFFKHQVTSASLNGFEKDWEKITWQSLKI